MTQIQDDCLNLTSPIATEEVFGVHAAAIEYYLTELITDVHLAGDSTGDDAIYHAQSLIGTCHELMGYLMAHSDRLMAGKRHLLETK
jgi:hypothetical protein